MTRNEEILGLSFYPHECGSMIDCVTKQDALKAMDISNREYATGFFKWYGVKMMGFMQYIKDVKPMVTSQKIEEKLQEFEGKTVDQLFTQYINSLNTKQNEV